MYIFAYICLLCALLASLGGGGAALLRIWEGGACNFRGIARCHWLTSGFLLLASALLLHALFWEDYRLDYVASYTDSVLPVFYRLTAFWAGQPGSMLFWALATAVCGLIFSARFFSATLKPGAMLWFWCFFHAIMAFFCLLLTCWSNPFIMLDPAPADGMGLNPLLQNPGMIFHPPLLFMGYAVLTVPGCLAVAQLVAQDGGNWPAISRPFIITGWVFLSIGILLGAWWAYMELGWGGYWGWDPVENASLLPWLAACAVLHTLAIYNNSGKLGRVCVFLMALVVLLSFFATWLTRSGVIQSVHAFGDGGVGIPLLVFTLLFLFLLIFITISAPGRGGPLSSPASREGALAIVAWIFLALALIILVATLWPVLSHLAGGAPQGLDASFYNRVCPPLAAAILLILAICPWLGWNGSFAAKGAIRFYVVCGAFIVGIGAIWFAGYRLPLPLICAAAAIAALCAMLMRVFNRSIWRDKKAFTALGAHLGMALLALGVAFSGPYKEEKDIFLARGGKENVGPYEFTLAQVEDGSGKGYDYLRASLVVARNGATIGSLMPERRIYAKFGDMQFSEVDVISTLGEDIYASLLGMDEDYRVLVQISLEPLVNWIWIGGALMCVLPLFGFLIPLNRRKSSG